MVAEWKLYTEPIAGLRLGNGDSEITIHQAFEPNVPGLDPTNWSAQGQITHAPIGGPGRAGQVTSAFWSYESFREAMGIGHHGGLDFVRPHGFAWPLDVWNWAAGPVVGAGYDPCAGYHAIVEIAGTSPQAYALYAHLQYGTLAVNVGDPAPLWHRLGQMGNTGSCTTGAHLHFAIFVMPTEHHSWQNAADRLWVPPTSYAGPMFKPQPPGGFPEGPSLVTYAGGLVTSLDAEAHEQGLEVIAITQGGGYKTWVRGAPHFVNREFEDHFWVGPHGTDSDDTEDLWVPAGTPMLVVNND